MTFAFPTVLVADDDPIVASVLAAAFEAAGAAVTTTENGELAVAAVSSAPPALLLLDAQMPVLDGYGACRAARALCPSLPIVIVSTNCQHWAERERSFAAGATACIAKPFNPATVAEDIATALHEQTLSHVVPPGGIAERVPPNLSPRDHLSTIDDVMQPALSAMRRAFEAELEGRAAALARASGPSSTDVALVRKILHKLTGTAGSLGFYGLSVNAQLLLNALDDDGIEACRDLVLVYCEELRAAHDTTHEIP